MTIEKEYYVYVLEVKSTGHIFYIGKGTGSRWRQHRYVANQPQKDGVYLYRKIRKLWQDKDEFTSRIIFRTFNEQEALDKEEWLINIIGKDNLCNILDGGDKSVFESHSEETKQKISKTKTGIVPPKETVERMRMSQKNNRKEYTEEQLSGFKDGFLSDTNRLANLKKHTLDRATKVKRLDTGLVYSSMCEAAKELGCSPNSIAQAIKENRPCMGIVFEKIFENKNKEKLVRRNDTNESWFSIKEAAKSIDSSVGYLHFCLKNNKLCRGIMLEYINNDNFNPEKEIAYLPTCYV